MELDVGESFQTRGNLLVDDVNHTVCNEDIRLNDLCAIDEHIHAINRNGQVIAVQSLEHRSVHERRAISHGTGVDDMIPENALDLLGGQIGQGGSNTLERGIVGRKDG